MRLTDLEPRWVGAGGAGITGPDGQPVPERHGVAISFLCPCGRRDYDGGHTPRLVIELTPPMHGGPPFRTDGRAWQRTGDSFDTLTLSPSILRVGGCAWHGWITNGEVRSC